jgi:hypothetical protein
MGIRAVLAKPFAAYIEGQTKKWASNPVHFQNEVFNQLITTGKRTLFGKDHGFESITNHEDFKKQVPIRDYEELKPYVEKVTSWRGRYIMERKASLLCQNFRHYLGYQIHSNFKRIYP